MLQTPAFKLLNTASFLRTQLFMLPVLLLFYQENGLTLSDFFLFQGIFSLVAFIGEIPCGYIADIFPRKNILILSFGLFLTRIALWFFIPCYATILIGEILFALSKAFFTGTSDSYIYDLLKNQHREKKMLRTFGRLNFFMSLGTAIASLLGAVLYQYLGFGFILTIELTFTLVSVLLLCFLPNVPVFKKEKKTLWEHYKKLFHITLSAFRNLNLRYYILYSGLLIGMTTVFVWTFQPLMKLFHFPIFLFGVVYFINHILRASAGIGMSFVVKHIPFKVLTNGTAALYTISLIGLLVLSSTASIGTGLFLLILMCVAIGFQQLFSITTINHIHQNCTSDVRATVSSLNTMFSRFVSSVLMIGFKFLIPSTQIISATSLRPALFIYLIIFSGASIFLLKRMYKNSSVLFR